MARRVAKQPNGSFCLFDDKIMDLLVMNATRDEIKQFNGGKLPQTKQMLWVEVLDTIKCHHGLQVKDRRILWDEMNLHD